jgi:hypothetical protein
MDMHTTGSSAAGRRRRWAAARVTALAAALAAAALLTAACGGGSPSATSPAGAAGSAGASHGRLAQALAFSHCMRSHGAPNFPDPDSAGGFPMNQSASSSVGAFLSAKTACNHLYPNMGKGQGADPAQRAAQQRHALLFAACMRRHGVPNFPDDWSGNVGQLISAGIEPSSPQLNAALTKCGF